MDKNCNFIPSKEQEEIFNFIRYGVGDAIVNACAGSGKSTTIVESIEYIPIGKTILFISFNKPIVEELVKRIREKYPERDSQIKIMTFHGLGYKMFINHFNKTPLINDSKYKTYVNKHMDEIAGKEYSEMSKGRRLCYRKNVLSIIEFARLNLAQNEKEINKIVKKYTIPVFSNEVYAAIRILRWGSENINTVDFLDLIWLPNELGYFMKSMMSDFIFIDEAQDTSPVQQELIKRFFKRDTRMIAVGDRYQTINAWCGSDQEAFDHIKTINNGRIAKDLTLSTSYRCPKNIVKMANTIAPNINAKEDAIDGEINYCANLNNINPGDMVLCRNISPLIILHRNLILNGKKSYIRNMEFIDTLIEVIDHTGCDSSECVLTTIKQNIIELCDTIKESLGCDNEECVGEPIVANMFEAYKTVEELSNIYKTKDEMISALFDISKTNTDDDGSILLSTIHRAKGLEADNVYVICPSLIPSKLAQKDWELDAEKYLQYVMITRAKKTLNMVNEAQFSVPEWIGSTSIMNKEIQKMREEIKNG